MQIRTLKEQVNQFVPFLTTLFNWYLSTGVMPIVFKAAYDAPLLSLKTTWVA